MRSKEALYGFVSKSKEGGTPEKDKIRNLTISVIHEFLLEHEIKTARFLTLPSAWWKFEREISKRFFEFFHFRINALFTACERDFKLFNLASIRIPKRNKPLKTYFSDNIKCLWTSNQKDCTLAHMDIYDYIEICIGHRKFNVIWIDGITPISFIDEQLLKVSQVMEDKSLFILTLLKGREHVELPVERIEYINTLLTSTGLELYNYWEYNDGCPMLHFIYKKI